MRKPSDGRDHPFTGRTDFHRPMRTHSGPPDREEPIEEILKSFDDVFGGLNEVDPETGLCVYCHGTGEPTPNEFGAVLTCACNKCPCTHDYADKGTEKGLEGKEQGEDGELLQGKVQEA